jgi:hypothetical protein
MSNSQAWMPTPEDLQHRERQRHKVKMTIAALDMVCPKDQGGCGHQGFMKTKKGLGRVHHVKCRCGWTGKFAEPD